MFRHAFFHKVVSFAIFVVLLPAILFSAIPSSERAALIALYNSTNGDGWTDNSVWKTPPLDVDGFAMPGTENTWIGITVSADHVIQISLKNNQLSGPIPSELGNLSHLQYLYLSSNQLSGSIPATLTNLTALVPFVSLDLRWNRLYTDNETLRVFLNSKQIGGDWESTQILNYAPVISNIPDQVVQSGGRTDWLPFTVSDPETDAEALHTYASSSNHVLVPPSSIQIKGTGANREVRITPEPGQTGSTKLYIWVTDGALAASDQIDLLVTAGPSVNQPPAITGLPDVNFPEGETRNLSLDDYVADPDHSMELLTWASLVANDKVIVTIQSDTRTAAFSAASGYSGANIPVIFTVTDPDGGSDSDTLLVTIKPVNKAPVITDLPDVTFDEDQSASLNLDDSVNDADHANAELIWTADVSDEHVTVVIDEGTHTAAFSASANFFGSDIHVIFTATDPGAATDSDTLLVTVDPVNDAPQFIPVLPGFAMNQGSVLSLPMSTLFLLVEDADNADADLVWTVLDNGHVTALVGADAITLTAPADWFGTDVLQIIVSDGALSDTAAQTIVVNEVADTEAPAAPQNIEAVCGTDCIDLTWDSCTEPDAAAYLVYRSLTPGEPGPGDLLATVEHPESSYSDNTAGTDITYYYHVRAVDNTGNQSTLSDQAEAKIEPLTTVKNTVTPEQYALEQNYPNPFNPETTIFFSLPERAHVVLSVYSLVGHEVARLMDETRDAGRYSIRWDATETGAGVYMIRMQAGGHVSIRKCILIK